MSRKEPPPRSGAAGQLYVPPRGDLRKRPLLGPRVKLTPIEPADGPELWQSVESSREHLTTWLPWVPFNASLETSQRYVEACASDCEI